MTPHIPAACLLVSRMYAEGYSTRQIAEERGTTLNTVWSQIRTTRTILRHHGHFDVGNQIKLGLALNRIYGPDTSYRGPWIDLGTL